MRIFVTTLLEVITGINEYLTWILVTMRRVSFDSNLQQLEWLEYSPALECGGMLGEERMENESMSNTFFALLLNGLGLLAGLVALLKVQGTGPRVGLRVAFRH